MTRLRAPLFALAATAVLIALGVVPPAEARILRAELNEPGNERLYGAPRVPISGVFTVEENSGRQVNVGIKRDVSSAPTATFTINQFDSQGRFSFVTSPDFAFNGRYLYNAVFVNNDNRSTVLGGCGSNPCTSQASGALYLAAPPGAATDLSSAYNEGERKITLTWAEAPEPDVLGWKIRRSVDGGPQGEESSVLVAKTPTFVDNKLPDSGGKLEYFVVTVRKGGKDQTTVVSLTAATERVSVKPRPADAPPTTPPPPGAATPTTSPFGSVVTAPPTSAAAKPPQRVSGNLGDFAKGLNPGGSTRTTLEDGTFDSTLPYDIPDGDELEVGAEEADPVFAPDRGGDGSVPAVAFVAAAALASVLAAHVLFILKQVKASDPMLESLPVLAVSAAGPVAASALAVRRQPRAAKRLPVAHPARVDASKPRRTPRKVR